MDDNFLVVTSCSFNSVALQDETSGRVSILTILSVLISQMSKDPLVNQDGDGDPLLST